MGLISIVMGLLIAGAIVTAIPRLPAGPARGGAAALALIVLIVGVLFSSVRFVPDDRLGVVLKNALGRELPPGKIIATDGEMGPQARILPPGWHLGLWPIIYDVELFPVTVIAAGEVGLLKASDGLPLPEGQIYAPVWPDAEMQRMTDAEYFLSGKGYKGPQASVLTPGTYRINPRIFEVEKVRVTNIPPASVGVIKSNVGTEPTTKPEGHGMLVDRGERGVWREPLPPQEYYLNTSAYEVSIIATRAHIVEFTTTRAVKTADTGEREISVRSADGFTFPVDVRCEYIIDSQNAPLVVATLRDDKESLQNVLNSAVRAIFRNSAEKVKALDYVQQRSQQEKQALEALSREMSKYGVTVTAVRIGNIGDEQSLGVLLKTQTDREIALQEQITFQEQQRAAEQRKALTRTVQEAEEEKRLATANYEVKIAEQDKQKLIIGATAEAEAITIKAQAQSRRFESLARQIGARNSALLGLLEVIGDRNIQITPRVMVSSTGAQAPGADGSPETVALIGTMLESMMSKDPDQPNAPQSTVPSASTSRPATESARP
jgi:uncharacterized membrane protein YqiK